jgi:hypothetical protein
MSDNDMFLMDDPSPFNMFAKRLDARCYAAGYGNVTLPGFGYRSPTLQADGAGGAVLVDGIYAGFPVAYPLQCNSLNTDLGQSFPRLQAIVHQLANWFADDASSFEEQEWVNSYALRYDPSYTIASPVGPPSNPDSDHFRPLKFPPERTTGGSSLEHPAGWYRCFPREIFDLSMPGSSGQRARFHALPPTPATGPPGGVNWYGALTTDATYFNQPFTTPVGQGGFSGKYFDWDGSTDGAGHHVESGGSAGWALSKDQRHGPDYIEQELGDWQITADGINGFFVSQPLWSYTFPGDIINGKWLNRLRDAIATLKGTTVGAGEVTDPTVQVGYPCYRCTVFTTFTSLRGHGTSGFTKYGYSDTVSSLSPEADCLAAYNASGPGTPSSPPNALVNTQLDVPITSYTLGRKSCTLSNYTTVPNLPTPINYDATFWMQAVAAGDWNDEGDGVLQGLWHNIGGVSGTAASAQFALESGNFPTRTDAPVPQFPAANHSAGWIDSGDLITLDWSAAFAAIDA